MARGDFLVWVDLDVARRYPWQKGEPRPVPGVLRNEKIKTWQGSVANGINPATGKPRRKYVYAATEKECVKKLRELQAALDAGTYQEPSKMTVGQWMDVWIEQYNSHVKPGTLHSYKAKVRLHIKPGLGEIKLQKLKRHDIQKFCNDLERLKGLSSKTVKCIHGILHAALEQAAVNGDVIRSNPADKTKLSRVESKEVEPIPENLIGDFVDRVSTHRFGILYLVTLFTGMRQSEVIGLTWDCIDFDNCTIRVKRQLLKNRETNEYEFQSLKNDKPRNVSPPPEVMVWLLEEFSRQEKNRAATGPMWSNPDNLVFTDEFGKHLNHNTVYKHYKKLVAELGLPALRFHDLRHTYAVNALQSGDDIKTVQEILSLRTRPHKQPSPPPIAVLQNKAPTECNALSVLFLCLF